MAEVSHLSRRTFLLSGGAALLSACSTGRARNRDASADGGNAVVEQGTAATSTPSPAPVATPAATPTPRPRGMEERALLGGTPSQTRMVIRHSGVRGPAVMVLGGVHGNEPGGWLAADEVSTWEPKAGSLITVPRANVQAIASFVRTFDDIGDLNRLYPGSADSPLLMERMSAAFLETCREFDVEVLLDMHESWAFYAEYPPNSGTGALGQTITVGPGPKQEALGPAIAEIANAQVGAREQFVVRDGNRFGRPGSAPPGGSGQGGAGRSSLSAGGYVPGLTPILIEMGQENQAQDRRVELHLITARAVLGIAGLV